MSRDKAVDTETTATYRTPCDAVFAYCPVKPRKEYHCQACHELRGNPLPRNVRSVLHPDQPRGNDLPATYR